MCQEKNRIFFICFTHVGLDGVGKAIARYLSGVAGIFYIRIVLFVSVIFLNSVIFSLIKFVSINFSQ